MTMSFMPIAIAPLLLINLLTSIFTFADKSLLNLADRYKLLRLLRYLVTSAFLFFLRILPSFFPSADNFYNYPLKSSKIDNYIPATGGVDDGGHSGIARALSQLLSIVNQIPVSSRKYEFVRSLAEKIIDENLLEANDVIREVNRTVLSSAFSRTLNQLEAAVVDRKSDYSDVAGETLLGDDYKLKRVLRRVRYYGDAVWRYGKSRDELIRFGSSAEKLAAELLWLAQMLTTCGCADEAVTKWASTSKLASFTLYAESRLQGSVVRITAFLLKQVEAMAKEDERCTKEQQRQTKMKMLISWLPFLCQASNGIDTPVLSRGERDDLERILGDIIETLEREEQEQVLSLWLHHFTYCQSSDWPNLHACYNRWCTASRKLLHSCSVESNK